MTEALIDFVHEAGLLKRIRRSGWWVAGIDHPESVAEHTFRAALIGYILASLEGADPFRAATMCLFHDLPEARTGDLHRVNDLYLDSKEAQKRAFLDQVEKLPSSCAQQLKTMYLDWEDGGSPEARIARDADLLECLIQAKEYQAQGCSSVEEWIKNTASQLRTKWAQTLAKACMEGDPKRWWHEISRRGQGGR
ncbi:MAG: HD domain-containing protein [Thermodesulfobacteriota bacterium]